MTSITHSHVASTVEPKKASIDSTLVRSSPGPARQNPSLDSASELPFAAQHSSGIKALRELRSVNTRGVTGNTCFCSRHPLTYATASSLPRCLDVL